MPNQYEITSDHTFFSCTVVRAIGKITANSVQLKEPHLELFNGSEPESVTTLNQTLIQERLIN